MTDYQLRHVRDRSTTARSRGSCSTGPRPATPRTAACSSSSTTRSCAAEADDTVRVVILGGVGPMFSSGHDMGSKESLEERQPGPTSTRRSRSTAARGWAPRAAMLQEWHYFFENTTPLAQPPQDHHRAGPGHRVRRGPHADVGVRPDRRRRRRRLRRRRRHPARHVRRRVLRPPVGVRPPQDQGADAHRRLASTPTRRTGSAWSARSSRARRARATDARLRPAHRQDCPRWPRS